MIIKSKQIYFLMLLLISSLILGSCNKNKPSPKPYVYFRIDLPEKEYQEYEGECPYSFEYPVYSYLYADSTESCWLNIYYPYHKATIYLTYKDVENNFRSHMEDSREFVYKHTVKADAISETFYEDYDKQVYGILYDIKGDAASSVQFFVTDSTQHFLRGALYFEFRPNTDSLAPVITSIREDIVHIFESLTWE
ncbi:MAG TPA: gliding motility lipoprotein GldD [Bacteroidales bacterium]|nr:gliding motility lipoprotein GldD [Bacteroidales bacterium]HRW20955.1 gliding motility lipoprotein GldD [Bacteroidales bacterium]